MVGRNCPTLPAQVTVFANRKAWWKCKDCGEESGTPLFLRSGGSKCPVLQWVHILKGV
ncbi:zinc-ribbon domain-containing protein [Clostridium sp.]|uniref:zinc-ribbon domain-containing protein n=1 Tax=Clostridium sp. TaxID=1506 RepID=UPI002585F20A|nr:zinc-ribbon domain-containing protein [Clostridium sp.]